MRKKKEIRLKKSGQAAKKAEKWKFWDVLSFLDAFTEENRYHIFLKKPTPPTYFIVHKNSDTLVLTSIL